MPRCLAIGGVVLMCVACSPPSQAAPKSSPVAKAATTPSEEPSPTPSPSGPPLAITSASFHAGEIGLAYAPASPAASGGVPPYTWSLGGGALPPGMGMDASGAVSGTPGALGTFLFTVQVTDEAGTTASIDTTINVVPRFAVSPTCPTNFPCMVEAGCVTVCGGFANQSGGMPPYKYRLVSGAIPTGMALSGLALIRAFPAPPAGGSTNWVFTVRVTDGLGAAVNTTAVFHVFPHIAYTSGPAPAACMLTGPAAPPCSITLTYTLGTPGLPSPPGNVAITPATPDLSKSITVMTGKGSAIVQISRPACPKSGTYKWNVSVVLSDGSVCGPAASVYCATAPATIPVTFTC